MTDEPISYLSEHRIRKLETTSERRRVSLLTTTSRLIRTEEEANRLRKVLEQIALCLSVEEASQLAADALATDLRQQPIR